MSQRLRLRMAHNASSNCFLYSCDVKQRKKSLISLSQANPAAFQIFCLQRADNQKKYVLKGEELKQLQKADELRSCIKAQ